jgi:putative serine/threonine protein kinase
LPEKEGTAPLTSPVIVPIEQLKEMPYAPLLCYPKPSQTELESRLQELRNHGVTSLEFSGKASAFGVRVPVLGKGFVGIVVIAHLNGQKAALKIRRVDADRLGLQHEAEMLAKANAVGVGPKFISVSTNFLLMQLIDGDLLPSWLETHKEKAQVRGVLSDVVEQCWRLDAAGLDHGELSKAPKHIIVNKEQKPFIVDFETASINRKPSNVTAICQFLFTSGYGVSRVVAETLGERNSAEIIRTLRVYKGQKTRENLDRVLQACLS